MLRAPEPTFDFETYSAAGFVWVEPGVNPKKPLGYWVSPLGPKGKKGLPIVGAAVYTEHETAEVLTLSYDIGRGVRRWRPGMPLPQDLFDHLAAGGTIEAHNAMFERLVWQNICVPKYGFPPLNPYALRCSMATARVNNLPGGLGPLGDVLNIDTKKDPEGVRLLRKLSIPRNPTKKDPRTRITCAEEPEEAEKLYGYCDTDVIAEQQCAARTEPMTEAELFFWFIDQEINHRGIAVDRDALDACRAVLDEALDSYGRECVELTGGLESNQLQEIRGWLKARGVDLPNMQAETIEDTLKRTGLPPDAYRVLEIRSLIGSASVKKLYSMDLQTCRDSRIRNLIVHHGARTGRPTGEGPQPLNLPRSGPKLETCGGCGKPHKPKVDACPWCAMPCPPIERPARWHAGMVDDVLEIMASRSLSLVEWFFGDALLSISGCIRGLYVAEDDKELIASDYSAIEAVVSAALAGEQWRLDTFAAKTDIYLAGASKITGRTLEEYAAYQERHGDAHPDRQYIGKISELACGFGGWVNSYIAFGSEEPEHVIKDQILSWRAASPQIAAIWGGQKLRLDNWVKKDELYGIEGAVIRAIQQPGVRQWPNAPSEVKSGTPPIQPFPETISFIVVDDVMRLRLPSGRELLYHEPRLENSDFRQGELSISYMTYNTNPKYGPMGWVRMRTWGSRVFENAVQAVAHDILRYAIINLRGAGYPCVLHIYDEIVGEVPLGTGSIDEFERIMMLLPPWAQGWPIRAAGGWRGRRYRKG